MGRLVTVQNFARRGQVPIYKVLTFVYHHQLFYRGGKIAPQCVPYQNSVFLRKPIASYDFFCGGGVPSCLDSPKP